MAAAPQLAVDNDPVPMPPDLVKYEERIKARLAGGILFAFVAIIGLWTWKAPQLPGDTAGMIVGGFLTAVGAIVQAYWGGKK